MHLNGGNVAVTYLGGGSRALRRSADVAPGTPSLTIHTHITVSI